MKYGTDCTSNRMPLGEIIGSIADIRIDSGSLPPYNIPPGSPSSISRNGNDYWSFCYSVEYDDGSEEETYSLPDLRSTINEIRAKGRLIDRVYVYAEHISTDCSTSCVGQAWHNNVPDIHCHKDLIGVVDVFDSRDSIPSYAEKFVLHHAQTGKVGKHKTKIYEDDGYTKVRYHNTDVISFNDREIILDSGGWQSNTTKSRINQACSQFGLGCGVFQKDYQWYVTFGDNDYHNPLHFHDGIKLLRDYETIPEYAEEFVLHSPAPTGTHYFYTDDSVLKNIDGLWEEYYTVIKVTNVPSYIAGNIAKEYAKSIGKKLSGGYFSSDSLPYNFDTNYTVLTVGIPTYSREFILHSIESYTKHEFRLSSPKKHPTVAIDLDGTILESHHNLGHDYYGKPLPGVHDALQRIRDAGNKIVIFTTRKDNANLRNHLDKHKIPYDAINDTPWIGHAPTSAKPMAQVYIDDRMVRFDGDWSKYPDIVDNFHPWYKKNKPKKVIGIDFDGVISDYQGWLGGGQVRETGARRI